MAYYSDTAVRGLLGDEPPADVARSVDDARAIYTYVHHHPGVKPAALRKWAETKSIDPDRVTVALELLARSGHVHELPDLPDDLTEPLVAPTTTKPKARRTK